MTDDLHATPEPDGTPGSHEKEIAVVRIGSGVPGCRLYQSGHVVHWIHARKAFEDKHPVEVTATVDDDDQIVVTKDDEVFRFRNHNPDAVAAALFLSDGQAWWKTRWGILEVRSPEGGHAYFYIADPSIWNPCDYLMNRR
ncbi:hypothetical protein [Lolliginicoccus levis]|uniref:hypothetical protein n=1 Tax=Lolliginicoccus levis TaxID=2919542 RepID=UPI00241CAA7D|nr:hypothetical protein [Lolliginicoccus levis]